MRAWRGSGQTADPRRNAGAHSIAIAEPQSSDEARAVMHERSPAYKHALGVEIHAFMSVHSSTHAVVRKYNTLRFSDLLPEHAQPWVQLSV